MMYGQMPAGSWIYIGTQGILQGTYETLAELANQHFNGTLKGTLTLTAGLGGMGGAQPLAVTMNEGVNITVEIDLHRIKRRIETKYLDYYYEPEDTILRNVISGTGISRIFETKTGNKVKSEEIFSLSLNGDDDAIEVINMFTIAFARTLSDLSLAFSSGGGIILAGSLSRSFLSIANKDLFNKHFIDGKSNIHKEILNKVGIKVANRGYTCLFGSLNYINSI